MPKLRHRSLRRTLRRSFQHSRYLVSSGRAWRARIAFWAGAVLVGTSCYAFVALGRMAETQFRHWADQTPWLPFLLTPLGLTAVAWITRRWFAGAEGGGVPQTILAVRNSDHRLRAQLLSMRIALGKFSMTIAGFLCGGALGIFAPAVQIGASIQRSFGLGIGIRQPTVRRGLILAGGAAGIAAAFNAPLAGIVFAIEELGRSFEERSSGLILSAVVIAGVTALAWSGGTSILPVSAQLPNVPQAWMAVVVIGLVGGITGALFAITVMAAFRLSTNLPTRKWLIVALGGGLTVAICGALTGGAVYGTGLSEIEHLLAGEIEPDLFFPIAKMAAALGTFVTGIPGGLFGPGLSIGAGLGASLGGLFPDLSIAAVIILGMVAFLSGMTQTPITAFVILLELAGYRGLILPLIATAFIAYAISKAICIRPLFRSLSDALLMQINNAERADRTEKVA